MPGLPATNNLSGIEDASQENLLLSTTSLYSAPQPGGPLVDEEDPMSKRHVVTVFVRRDEKVLILRRSDKVGSYRGKWAGVSGSVNGGSPLMQAMKELEEETGLKGADVRFVKAGREFEVPDGSIGTTWVVHPFLFDAVNLDHFELDWEHSEHKWILPRELELFETVPMLGESLTRVF